jgi:hypothetical protein
MCDVALQRLDWVLDPRTSEKTLEYYAFTENFIICRKVIMRENGATSYTWAEYDPEKVGESASALDVGQSIDSVDWRITDCDDYYLHQGYLPCSIPDPD